MLRKIFTDHFEGSNAVWTRRLILLVCSPLSLLYAAFAQFSYYFRASNSFLLDSQKLSQEEKDKSTRLQSFVIGIGNLAVGGRGKTPCTLALARYFLQQGESVVIIAKGVGGRYWKERRGLRGLLSSFHTIVIGNGKKNAFPYRVVEKMTQGEVSDLYGDEVALYAAHFVGERALGSCGPRVPSAPTESAHLICAPSLNDALLKHLCCSLKPSVILIDDALQSRCQQIDLHLTLLDGEDLAPSPFWFDFLRYLPTGSQRIASAFFRRTDLALVRCQVKTSDEAEQTPLGKEQEKIKKEQEKLAREKFRLRIEHFLKGSSSKRATSASKTPEETSLEISKKPPKKIIESSSLAMPIVSSLSIEPASFYSFQEERTLSLEAFGALTHQGQETPLEKDERHPRKKLALFTSIARPNSFLQTLDQLGFNASFLPLFALEDHARIDRALVIKLHHWMERQGVMILLMTEKDLVKWIPFRKEMDSMGFGALFALGIEACFDPIALSFIEERRRCRA